MNMKTISRYSLNGILSLTSLLVSVTAWAGITLSENPSYDGNYTVSWTSYLTGCITTHWIGGEPFISCTRLQEQVDGGSWQVTPTADASVSHAFSGKAAATYSYRICSEQVNPSPIPACEDNVLLGPVTVNVLKPSPPSTPTGPSTNVSTPLR